MSLHKLVPLLLVLILCNCGKETQSETGSDEEARFAAQSSGLIQALTSNQKANNLWKNSNGFGVREAISNPLKSTLVYNAEVALKTAQEMAKNPPQSTPNPSNPYKRGAISGSPPVVRIETALNTMFPGYELVQIGAAVVSGAGFGFLYSEFLNSGEGFKIGPTLPILVFYPTGIPAAAMVGALKATGTNKTNIRAALGGYVDATQAFFAYSSPEKGTKACYISFASPQPYCQQVPPPNI